MLIKNLYFRIGSNILRGSLSIISSIIIVHVFGVKVIGQIAYYYGLVGMLTLFSDLGVGISYRKFLTDPGSHEEDIATYILIKTTLLTLSCIIALTVFFFYRPTETLDSGLVVIVFVVTLIELVSHFFSDTLSGKRDFLIFSKIEVLGTIVLFAYNLAVCFLFPKLYWLAMNMVITPVILIIAGTCYCHKNRLFYLKKPTKKMLLKYVKYTYPIAFSSVVGIFSTHFEKVLIGKMIGMRELGLYRLALSLFSGFDMVIKPVTNALFTELSYRLNRVSDFVNTQFKEIVFILNLAGSLVFIFILFLSQPVVDLFYGPDNVRAAYILMCFSLVVVSRLLWRPYLHLLYAIEAHHPLAYLSVISFGLRLGLYFVLIPITIKGHLIGAMAIPLSEAILWIIPTGVYNFYVLKKRFDQIHLKEMIIKMWTPLLILTVVSACFSFSLILFPIILILFLLIEYHFNIITQKRWSKMVSPTKSL